MDANTTRQTATEVGKVLDALAALSYDIECHCCNLPDDAKVLTALRGRETCAAIREAVTALKRVCSSLSSKAAACSRMTLHSKSTTPPEGIEIAVARAIN